MILHAAFILFVVAGGLLVLRHPGLAWVHLPCVAWGVLVEVTGWTCPLTPLEHRLRDTPGYGSADTGFIEQYLAPLIYPAGLTQNIQYLLAAVVLLVNFGVYLFVWKRYRNSAVQAR